MLLRGSASAGRADPAAAPTAPKLAWNRTLPAAVTGSVALSHDEQTLYALYNDAVSSDNQGHDFHNNASLVALDAASGTPLWTTQLPCPKRYACAASFGPVVDSKTASTPGVFAIGTGGVFKLAASTGEILWNVSFPEDADAVASGQPILVANKTSTALLVCSLGSLGVVALDSETGELRASYEPPLQQCLSPTWSPLTGEVYVGCNGSPHVGQEGFRD